VRKYTYDKKARRYRDPSGRFVSQDAVRRALDDAFHNASKRISELSDSLRNNAISLTDWEFEMRQAIKDVHLYSRALGRGGWAQLDASDFGFVGAAVKKQYTYLNRFAAEISQGYNFDGRFRRRSELYAEAGRNTYYDALDLEMIEAGMTEERNVLSSAEHCDECVEETDRGWVPIGSLVPIGERTCLVSCKCFKEYR
jgi:hypothetical protein